MFYISGILFEREIIKKTFESLSVAIKYDKLQLKNVMDPIQTVHEEYTIDE